MAAFMDELVIDPISGEQITPRHAILVPEVKGVKDILEYLKSVGNVIGPRNIRSAYKVDGNIKVYLRFAKDVEVVISGGVTVNGRCMDVKYGLPPGTEVALKGVDSEIPNTALSSTLSQYGTVVSKITTDKVQVDDPDFSHIESDTRRTFMQIKSAQFLPQAIDVIHCSKQYHIAINVGRHVLVDPPHLDPYSPTRTFSQHSPTTNKSPDVKHLNFTNEECRGNELPSKNQSVLKGVLTASRGRGRWRTVLSPSQRVLKKSPYPLHIDKTKKFNARRSRMKTKICRLAYLDPCKASGGGLPTISDHSSDSNEKPDENEPLPSTAVVNNGLSSVVIGHVTGNSNDKKNVESGSDCSNPPDNDKLSSVLEHPFTLDVLHVFLREVKNHRNPKDVALNLLKEHNPSATIQDLCIQLKEYHQLSSTNSIKLRITRLIQIFTSEND